jgi:hypothetical protein
MNRTHVLGGVLVFLVIAYPCGGQPFQPTERTLLLDHFDEDFVPDGTKCTKPAVIKPAGDHTGGRPGKGGEFVPGRFGKVLRFHKLMQLQYPAVGNIDLSAGLAEFWVALNFDAAKVMKHPGVLSNQVFLTIGQPGGIHVCVYSTLGRTCVGVWDKQRQLVCYGAFSGFWKKGEWHHLELRWGRQLELWCDGRREVTEDWQGLFGPIDVQPEDLRLYFGSHIGFSNVESEFALDEFRVLGPGGDQVSDYPTMTIPRIKPPVIDGKIAVGEWDGAAQTTGFVGLNERTLVEAQTIVRAGWDDEALYLCYECLDPQNRPLTARLKQRDSGIFGEDAVDVILQPEAGRYPYYHLASSAIGTRYDARADEKKAAIHDAQFNPEWTVATSHEPGRWVVECKIPFRELDGRPAPKDGERWRVNLCRDADSMSRYSSWAFAAGDFHRMENFGELVFSRSDRGIRLGPLGDWARGTVNAQVELTGLQFAPLVTVRGKVVGASGKPILETENRLADYRALTIKPPSLVSGLYNLTVRAATAQGDMYYQRLPLRVVKPYDITVDGYPYDGHLWVTANVGALREMPKGLVARSRLLRGGKVYGSCETAEFQHGIGKASISMEHLPIGKYVVKSEAVAPDGKVLGTAEADFEQFAKPAWWHNRIGIDHSVPSPWTPVRVTDRDIEVYGRKYACADGSLPRQIVNQGAEMLAAPITLQIAADGATADLAKLPAVNVAAAPDMAILRAETRMNRLAVNLVATTEFDGLQRYDLMLTPTAPVEVKDLVLEVPIKSKYASFLLPSNGINASAMAMGTTPWRSAFLPQVWLGNDDLGLAWFAESDQWWHPHDEQMLEVVPQKDRTVLRCQIIRSQSGTRQPLRLEKPVTITFGLMATPVKPSHAGDPFWFRFGDDLARQSAPVELLHYPGVGNVDPKQGTLEFCLAPTPQGPAVREVLNLSGQGGGMSLSMRRGTDSSLVLTVTDGSQSKSVTASGLDLKPNEFTHVAVTWGKNIELFVAGKHRGELSMTLPADLAKSPDKFGLRFGCAGELYGATGIVLDELRISNIVRYRGSFFEVPKAAFTKDPYTLLLDHLDEKFRPDGETAETRAEVCSGQPGELGGLPSLGCRVVTGKFGSAMQVATGDSLATAEMVRHYGVNASLLWWWAEDSALTTGWPPPLLKEPLMPKIRETVKEHNALGARACPYMGYPAFGAPCPLSDQFGHEWGRQPLSTQPAEPPKGHYFWDVCPRSGFADYMAAGTQWVLDDLGFYGCYTDGLAQVYPCQNTHHGCGYYDERGGLHSTWPLFATREMMKRMYRLIHARHPDAYLVNHVSFNLIIPSMSFTDVYYSGEHEQYEDLTKFRVRWQDKQWGIWPALLGDDSHSYKPLHMTYCLLHGVSVLPQGFLARNDMFRKTAMLWQTYDRFGYRSAEWIPYYRAEPRLVQSRTANVKISVYLKRQKRAMLVVANLGQKAVTGTVRVDLAAMGLRNAAAVNALDGRPLPLSGGILSVALKPTNFALVEIDGNAADK